MSRKSHQSIVVPVLLFLGLGLASLAQAQNFAGTWDLTASAQLPNEETQCMFDGQAMVTQSNGSLAGEISMMLLSGPDACPSEMMADMTGEAVNGSVQMGVIMGGNLGEANFSGQPGDVLGGGLVGGFDVFSGEFNGLNGGWSAMMVAAPPMPVETAPIPSMAFYGALILLLMIMLIGGIKLRHRNPV